MSIFGSSKSRMVVPEDALPGRSNPVLPHPAPHAVLGTSLTGPWPEGTQVLYLAMGCFWGAEEILWRRPGVVTTSVGYMGGFTPNPTYEEVCSGRTGQTETAMVAYDPAVISTYDILKEFWESHDPTQGYRQGNDHGTQYRSAAYWTTEEQRDLIERTRDAYATVIARARLPRHHHRDRAGHLHHVLPGRGLPPAVPLQEPQRLPLPREHRARPPRPGMSGLRELTGPVDLCLPDGRLNPAAVGWTRHPLHTANLRGRAGSSAGSTGRSCRQDAVFAVTVSDLDYAALHAVYLLDASGAETVRTALVPLAKVGLPPAIASRRDPRARQGPRHRPRPRRHRRLADRSRRPA